MNDDDILKRISALVDEEHHLNQKSEDGELDEEGHARIKQIEVNLDQCWDLLRQRRARRSAHLNPDEAQTRDASTVEHYLQ